MSSSSSSASPRKSGREREDEEEEEDAAGVDVVVVIVVVVSVTGPAPYLHHTWTVQPFLITRAEHGGIAWYECCLHVGNSSGDRIDYRDTRRCFESDATSSHPTFIHVRPHSEDCLRHLLKLQHSGRAPPGAQGLLQPEGGAADLQPLPARARGGHPGGAIVDFPPRAWRAEQGGSERHGSRRSECKWWRHMAVAVVQDCRDELRTRRAYEHLD